MTRVIAFTGLDGTGKSTQARLLTTALEERGMRVATVHHFAPTMPTVRSLKHRTRRILGRLQRSTVVPGTAVEPAEPRRGEPSDRLTGRFSTPARTLFRRALAIYWTMTGYLKGATLRLRTRKADIVVSDRCFIDDLVRIRWKCATAPPAGNLLLRAQPRPDLVFSLAVDDSSEAWRRKKERNTTVAALEAKQRLHRTVVASARPRWPVQVINVTGRPAAQVHQQVLQAVLR